MKKIFLAQDNKRDDKIPASFSSFTFISHGSLLYGTLYSPQGKGPHPIILLLNGFPEHEKNTDISQAFRNNGFAVFNFCYRGSCGSQGNYTYANCIEDVQCALNFILEVNTITRYFLNPEQIHLIGHSFGGFLALYASLNSPQKIKSIASISGANLGYAGEIISNNPDILPKLKKGFEEKVLLPLHGATPNLIINELIQNKEKWNLNLYSSELSQLPILLTAAEYDTLNLIQIHHKPLFEAIQNYHKNLCQEHLFKTDHFYSDHRNSLILSLLKWVIQHL